MQQRRIWLGGQLTIRGADKIDIKNGKAVCESDCDRRDILALRNDPEISALMAGEARLAA